MYVLGLCVIVGGLLSSWFGENTAAIAAPASNPGPPVTDLSGVTPNWDKNLPSASRFTVLAAFNNQAVRDNNTGLVWEQAPVAAATANWFGAHIICATKDVAGTRGWRLPSVAELASVTDPSLPAPFVPNTVFTGALPVVYWSASSVTDFPTSAWFVDLSATSTPFVHMTNKSDINHVWCVRGPGQDSPY
jgi:hypothetical protein